MRPNVGSISREGGGVVAVEMQRMELWRGSIERANASMRNTLNKDSDKELEARSSNNKETSPMSSCGC